MIRLPQVRSRAAQELRGILESGRPLTYIQSPEELRVCRLIEEVAGPAIPVWTWSCTEGLRAAGAGRDEETREGLAALERIAGMTGPAIFHLEDFHEELRASAAVRRRLRDLYFACQRQGLFVVISSAVKFLPAELERDVVFVDLRPPDLAELADYVRDQVPALGAGFVPEEEVVQQYARALRGLTLEESTYALRRALTADARLGPASMPALLEEKRLLINRTGYIEYIATGTELNEVGGLDVLKTWLVERKRLFQLRDDLSSEIVPKGLLMMGIPGCGKSLCVKAISNAFELPLYRIDMTEIFSGRHGRPEGAFVHACRLMEEMAPAILWFDEIEMAINSAASEGEQGRMFAFFLTWMQEKTRGLFVAATANRIDLLPAEILRKGRFDEVFFVDLPTPAERAEVFKIHLARRGQDPKAFNIEQLMPFSEGWAGAEIEQCVISAITRARLAERALTDMDLVAIAAKLVPLSRTMKEQIAHIRAWAFERAMKATKR